mmetsp:Transcript_7913/g.18536  ORF Transcript_7913/g.18536 Transcript_7913/m.18536 type:complete len:524 (-) Transcript_7913:82-1653(-)
MSVQAITQCGYPPPPQMAVQVQCAYPPAQPHMPPPQANAPAASTEEIMPVARNVLDMVLENRHEDSVQQLAEYAMERSTAAGLNIMQGSQDFQVMTVLEALTWWIQDRTKAVDRMIPTAQEPAAIQLGHHLWQILAWAPQNSDPIENLVDGFYGLLSELMGHRTGCLTSAAIGKLVQQEQVRGIATLVHQELVWATSLLSAFSNALLELQERIAWLTMALKIKVEEISEQQATALLMAYFHNFCVDVDVPGYSLEAYPSGSNTKTGFSVTLIDTYGALIRFLKLLQKMQQERLERQQKGLMLAVDSEGINLGATGPLVLLQIAIIDERTHVYVIDVMELGPKAFDLQLLDRFSLRSVLENQAIRKVWFDPRRDVDALYNQFSITPAGIFDVQIAEILDRKYSAGTHMHRHSQTKCLQACERLSDKQKEFANWINEEGKRLFEPKHGGRYEVFRERPLNLGLLVYSAHDARYLFDLYEQYANNLPQQWMAEVERNSDDESRFYIRNPGGEATSVAPDFTNWNLL